uniref:Kinesin-like protein n=1 Tax=Panagrolaimus sp. PS1159 TaxID=55785 RepID=A0AC35F2V8_9BILA
MVQKNINVVARVRPFSKHIGTNGESSVETDTMNSTITIKSTSKKFIMDKVFDGNATQEAIYENVGQPAVDAFIDGINGTIFAYGQTGSGKTFTMLGPDGAHDGSNNGIIPRSIERMFAVLDAKVEKNPDSFKWTLKCSFLELYNENLYDLLLPKAAATLKIQSCKENVTVVGAAEMEVKNVEECMNLLLDGWKKRKVDETSMNRESSRSHAIFLLTLVTEHPEGMVVNSRSSRLNLVDLAGSERQGQTKNSGKKLKEAGSINKSLSTLTRIIRDVSVAKEGAYISYRDSLLTHLLRDSLGGNAKTTVIVNVHPNAEFVGDTASTLTFAETCKKVKNNAHVNEAISSENVEAWKAEIKRLREENSQLKDELEKTRYSLSPYPSTINVFGSDIYQSTVMPFNDLLAKTEALAVDAKEFRHKALENLMSIMNDQKAAQKED